MHHISIFFPNIPRLQGHWKYQLFQSLQAFMIPIPQRLWNTNCRNLLEYFEFYGARVQETQTTISTLIQPIPILASSHIKKTGLSSDPTYLQQNLFLLEVVLGYSKVLGCHLSNKMIKSITAEVSAVCTLSRHTLCQGIQAGSRVAGWCCSQKKGEGCFEQP